MEMRQISEVADQELLWVQPAKMKMDFELRAGDEVVATLGWQRASLATGRTSDHEWTFKREGFWHPRITVRAPGSDANLALFNPHWAGGGTLELDGRLLRFGAANFWHSQWDWLGSDDAPLLHFKSRRRILKIEGQVEVDPVARTSPDLPLLSVLVWYLLVLFARDAAEGAGATGAIVAVTAT
jgi:hypothetical protein